MSKLEILAGLSKLSSEEREEILARLLELEDQELSSRANASEMQLFDEEAARYLVDQDPGSSWVEVEDRLRRSR